MAGNNRIRTMLIIAAGLVVIVIAAALYAFLGGESGVASGTITAPTLDLTARVTPSAEPTAAAVSPPGGVLPQITADAPSAAIGEDPSSNIEAQATDEAAAERVAADAVVFNIIPEESEVTFLLNEVLMGNPTTVIGRTDQIAGQILVDFDNPSASAVGTIRINVRTLTTDSEMRNRAIRRAILLSDQDEFEYAEFSNIAVSNMPADVTFGQAFSFQITGDFALVGISNRLTFDVTVMPLSQAEITGTATTIIQRAMYNLVIPDVPGVAGVTEDVELAFSFTARAD